MFKKTLNICLQMNSTMYKTFWGEIVTWKTGMLSGEVKTDIMYKRLNKNKIQY